MFYKINLLNIANQSASFTIEDKSYDINLRTVKGMLYCDLFLNGEAYFHGRRCINKMPLIYTNQTGNFYFYDKNGNDNPTYDKLNDRFLLIYDDNYIL